MKRLLKICIVIIMFFSCNYCFGEEPETNKAEIIKVDKKTLISQNEKRAIVSFDVTNVTEVYYPSLYYIVTLSRIDGYVPKDFHTYDAVEFEIGPKQTKTLTYNCELPENLPEGRYCLAISINEKIYELSSYDEIITLNDIKTRNGFLNDLSRTSIVVDGEERVAEAGPKVNSSTDIKARLGVKSSFPEECIVVPKIVVYERYRMYNPVPVLNQFGDSIKILPGEEKIIDIELPFISIPESYLIEVCLVDESLIQVSEQYSYRYVTQGEVANIKSFDAKVDENNDILLNVWAIGPADSSTLENCVIECQASLLNGMVIGEKSETLDLGNVSKECNLVIKNNNFYNENKINVSVKILYNGKQIAYEERNIDINNTSKTGDSLFSDLAGTRYEDAVKFLNGLNIINGYPDGTFRPQNTITRAEFTAIVTKLNELKLNESEASRFFDVSAEHWAKNYINTCANNGLVNGYLDGSFMPDNNVKYSEAITILINALGYKEEVVARESGWPDNYTSKSTELGLHNNIKDMEFGKPATRGDVAILTMNAYLMK